MKKLVSALFVSVALLSVMFSFGGCIGGKFDNELPFKTAIVSIDYSDTDTKKARLSISNDTESFDIVGIQLYNKDNERKIKNLYGGDRLEIFYTDNDYQTVDHILVKKSKVLALELYSDVVPGSGKIDVYSTETGVSVNHTTHRAFWAIDIAGNYIDLENIKSGTKLYGTYVEEEIQVNGEGAYQTKLHYIHALYLYDPR